LSVAELEALFEGRTRFVELLAEREHPLEAARTLLEELPEAERLAVLDAHPAIGAREGLSAVSKAEQGSEEDPAVLEELAELNRRYEERFGFRFVVFVNRRPRSAIVPVLRERLGRTRAQELSTALDELVAIARDRWQRG
jgi:2-oxo-4-hydroxy-4-carboxy--5-ureidoimidazoline (OHCU) decarboxylase